MLAHASCDVVALRRSEEFQPEAALRLPLLLLAAAALLLLAAFALLLTAVAAPAAAQRAALVVTDKAIHEPLRQTQPVQGRFIARQAGPVAAQSRGAVTEMLVAVGDRVYMTLGFQRLD